jgi:hypothetical protein
MAIVKRQILGSLSGVIGDIVFKQNRGTKYTSIRPKKYKKTKSQSLINSRSRFSKRVAFCRFILQSPLLKLVWNKAKVPGKYPYHKIFKYNYRFISNEKISSYINIIPKYFSANFSNYHIDENSFSYEFQPLDEFMDNLNLPIYFVAFIYMYSPIDENSERKEVLILLEEESRDFVTVQNQMNHFDFKIEKGFFNIMNDFQKVLVFPAIIARNKKDKLVWANSDSEYLKGEKEKIVAVPKVETPKPDEPYRSVIIDIKMKSK